MPCGGLSKPRNNEPHRPQAVPPWGRWSKIRARRWPRPVPASKAKSPRRRLRPGGDVADVQVPCTRYGDRRPLARARFRWRPAAMGGACGATPRLAAAGCAKACRPRRWRFAPVRHEGRFTDTPPGFAMEHPRHASTTSSQSAARSVLARRRRLALPASGRKPVKPSRGDAESTTAPFGSGRPVRPWLVVNPGEATAAPWASWPQPSSANNFPAAARLPRAANSLRFQVLHCVAAAARCGPPIPRRPVHNKDALARPCSTRKEKHHG